MIRFALIFITLGLLLSACQKGQDAGTKKEAQEKAAATTGQQGNQESQTKEAAPVAEQGKANTNGAAHSQAGNETSVPLVTEVMTKEELQAYLKEKNVPVITKENFKEPELVWEKTFDVPIDKLSDLTEKGNSIALTAQRDVSGRSILFLDGKGNIKRKIDLKRISPEVGIKSFDLFAIAKGGTGAIVAHAVKKDPSQFSGPVEVSLIYYDEEGLEKWKKNMSLPVIKKISISDNGETIAAEEGNPNWSIEEWGGKLNTSRIVFFNNKGHQLFEYNGFRNLGWGEFSADGNYYVGIFAWQEDKAEGTKSWGKLIYIDMKTKQIVWEKPFEGTWWRLADGLGKEHLAISKNGEHIASIDFTEEHNIPAEKNPSDFMQVIVFNKNGRQIVRLPGGEVSEITEGGLLNGGKVKGWVDIAWAESTGLFGEPPYFCNPKREWSGEKPLAGTQSYKILSAYGSVLWEAPESIMKANIYFKNGMQYMIAEIGSNLYVFKLQIDLAKGGASK